MKTIFILDACALIAWISGETGAAKINDVILNAIARNITLKINQVNLFEVYYHAIKVYGIDGANKILEETKEYPIEIIVGLSNDVFEEAGRIKSKYKIPLGDSIAAAECIVSKGILVTSDHKDFEKIENEENIKINWFR